MSWTRQSCSTFGQKRALATAVSAALASAHSAYAQQAPPQTAGLEEIVVTATKRVENLQNVPLSVTAFGTDDIAKHGFNGLQDYAAFIPSLSLANREPGGTNVVFRGVASSGLSYGGRSSSAIYLDEQPITSAGRQPDPRLVDVERLEALSGPQGTLFGASSQSGTLRIITNKPDPREASAWVDANTSSVDGGGVGYDVSAMVNIPLSKDKVALRLVGFQAEDAGYVDNVLAQSPGTGVNDSAHFTNADNVHKDVNKVEHAGGRAALRWEVNDQWTLDFSGLFQNTKYKGFGDVDPAVGDLQQIRFESESLKDDWWQSGLTLGGDVGFADVTVAASYFERDFKYEADNTTYEFNFGQAAAYTGYQFYDFSFNDHGGDISQYGGDPRGIAFDGQKDKRTSFEARLTSHPGSRWSWIAGLFYNKNTSHAQFDAFMENYHLTNSFQYYSYYEVAALGGSPLAPTDVWFRGIYDTSLKETAVFGEIGYDFTDHFAVTAGGRWFKYDESFTLHQEQPPGFDGYTLLDKTSTSSDSDHVSKLNLTYKFDPTRLVYFTYSEGFRNGGSTPVRDRSILPGSYSPDVLKNYELGAKTEWADRRVRLNLTLYDMTWDDIQIQVEDPQPGVFALATVNFPQAQIQGGDAQLEWLALDNLTLGASLSYIDAKLSQSTVLCFPNNSGDQVCLPPAQKGARLPLTPDWKATFSFDYNFTQRMLGGTPFLRFNYAYVGELVNSLAGFESITFGSRSNKLDAYDTGDLQFGVEADRWTATLALDNVWDERAEQFINNRWGTPRISINRPRTLAFTFKYNF